MPIPNPDCWADTLPAIDISKINRIVLGGWYRGLLSPYSPDNPSWNPADREWWIYFAQGSDGGPIKIGKTTNLSARAKDLGTAYPFGELRFVGLIRATYSLEKETHRRFLAAHLRGEWFRPTPELVQYIRTIRIPEAP